MDYKFIVQYGEYREVPGYCQHPSIPDDLCINRDIEKGAACLMQKG